MIKLLIREGVPKVRVAKQLGVSRQTVYNQLGKSAAEPKEREKRGSKLDPHKSYIRGRLEKFDLPATVLIDEIRRQGYTGAMTILREFVRPLKEEIVRRVTERFETVPGQQAQLDWGECGTIAVDGERRKLYCFVFVLGYSRMMYAHFTTSTKTAVLLRCLQAALRTLGVPQEILVDNMKQAVEHHDASTGTVRWNKAFLDFAEHFGFMPLASPPYWPRVKGKVERGVGYVKKSFLEGRSFTDLDDLNHQLEVWLDTVANVRIHGTTGERPAERYARDEREALRAGGAAPVYDTRPVILRKVPSDSHVSYQGTRYSVLPKAVGHTVTLRPEGDRVGTGFAVYLGEEIVARHRVRPKGSPRITLEEHAAAIRRLSRRGEGADHRRPRGGAPHFIQAGREGTSAHADAMQVLERLRRAAPAVETRELSLYEELLHEELAGSGAGTLAAGVSG